SSEAARDSVRAPMMRAYRARLAEGPTITLHQSKDSLSWGYDPTALVGFDLRNTVYPFGSFSAPWGKLTVDSAGVLVANDFSAIRVGGSGVANLAGAKNAAGDGWTLRLNPGWILSPDPSKPGSCVPI